MSAGSGRTMSVENRETLYKNAKTHEFDNTSPAVRLENDECLKGLTMEEIKMFISIICKQYFDRGIRIKINYGDLDHGTGELKNVVTL